MERPRSAAVLAFYGSERLVWHLEAAVLLSLKGHLLFKTGEGEESFKETRKEDVEMLL